MKNKNILEFCLSPDLGGLELFVLNYYKYFKKIGGCKIIIAPNKKLDKALEDKDKSYIKRNKFFPIFPAIKLAKYIDEYKIDFIHFHWTKDIATVVLARVLSKRKPQLMQTRHMNMTRFKDDFYHKWLYKNIDILHTVTNQVKEQIQKFIPVEIRPRVETIYLGTKESIKDEKTIKSLKDKYQLDNSFVIGVFGRIEPTKGQYLVIEALSKLKEFDIKLLVVGHTMDDEYLSELKNKVKNLSLEDKVIFTGFTSEVNEHMSLCDVSVLATTKETFGLVLIEAMINKVCAIAVNSGGPLEIIDDKKTGLLFERRSDDLADKIKLVYKDENYRKRLAQAGYEKVKDSFDYDKQVQSLYKLISQA